MRRALPLVAAILCFFAGALIWLGGSRVVSRRAFDQLSSLNTSDDGLSLARAYLSRGRRVALLTSPLAPGRVEPNAVVIRTGYVASVGAAQYEESDDDEEDAKKPTTKALPPPLLTQPEEEWVRRGGRLMIAGAPLPTINITDRIARKVFPIWNGVDTIALPERSAFQTSDLRRGMHVLYAAGRDTVLAREIVGRGEVILVAEPDLFDNRNLGTGNHLALLAAIAGSGRPVWFDEYVHGLISDAGVIALLREWGLGPLLVLLGLAALLIFWRNSKRIGSAEDDYRDTRSDAVDLVSSLGALYDRSMTDAEAIALYHEALTRSVAAHTGLRGEALQKRVAELTNYLAVPRGDQKLPRPVFQRMLTTINDAFRALEPGGLHADHQ